MTLWQAYNSYNPDMRISFDVFLRTCLEKKFKSELTRRYRKKRIINKLAVSLDATDESDEKHSLLDFIPSDFDTFEELVLGEEADEDEDDEDEDPDEDGDDEETDDEDFDAEEENGESEE